MQSVIVPPIKSQGIKTKLVPWINTLILSSGMDLNGRWIEPFFGTGVVGFNVPVFGPHLVGDTNPHIIRFYQGIQSGEITAGSMRAYLERESGLLAGADGNGYAYFREVRDRFNKDNSPYDFIFLSRAGFNGLMRFNRRGEWNVPFCKKPERFSPAYITKICNQIQNISRVIKEKEWEFMNVPFLQTLERAQAGDLIYCDPPYFGRYVDYYNGWSEADEHALFDALSRTPAKFILSTWHHNDFRANEMIEKYWGRFNMVTQDHFYHGGGHIENRHSMKEALIFNFELQDKVSVRPNQQLELFAEAI